MSIGSSRSSSPSSNNSKKPYQTKWENGKYRELLGHTRRVLSVAWSKNGKLASGSMDNTVHVWDISHSRPRETIFKGHTNDVVQLRWDPSKADILATASSDKTVKLWDTRKSSKPTHSISTPGQNINLAYSPDGNYIAVGNREDVVSIIDVRKGDILKKLHFKVEVNELSWDRSGRYLFTTTGSGVVNLYPSSIVLQTSAAQNKDLSQSARSTRGHSANVYCIDFDPSGQYFATGSADSMVAMWTFPEMICLKTFSSLAYSVRALSFSHDSEYLAFAGEDAQVEIGHIPTGDIAHSITTSAAINTVAWHPKEHILAYAGDDRDKKNIDYDRGNIYLFQAK